jgi:hypothetical protein
MDTPKKNKNEKISEENLINDDAVLSDEEQLMFDQDFPEIEELEDIEEPDEDVLDIENSENFDLIFKLNTNKHRQEGKHALDRDTLFKGKLEKKEIDENNNEIVSSTSHYYEPDEANDNISFFDQYDDQEDYLNQNNLSKDVYDILKNNTSIDFTQNRRKPNKEIFNEYYNLLLKELGFRYTKSEIFVELSYYFTDNIFNMFKLLDKRPATIIIKELTQKGFLRNLNGVNFL